MKDLYDILEVPPTATLENIKEQYRFLVQAWHPDKFPSDAQKAKAEDKIKEINGAFEVLGNPAKRAQYDRERNSQSSAFARDEVERREREQAEAAYRYAQEQREREAQAEAARRRAEEEFLRNEAYARRRVEEEFQRAESFSRRQRPSASKGSEQVLALAPGVELVLVQIRAGEFLYGQQNWPVHLNEYWIGKHPITNAQFNAFLKASRYPFSQRIPPGKDDFPIVNVSWLDAAAFCTWAAQACRQPVRLPTEAEWEKAARGTDGRTYPWGDQAPNSYLCNFNLAYQGPTPVLKFSPGGDSPYGCSDLAGNVWEWTADWYADSYLNQNPRANPKGAYSGQSRVLRGGSWHDNDWFIRSTYRNWDPPTSRSDILGFRCAI